MLSHVANREMLRMQLTTMQCDLRDWRQILHFWCTEKKASIVGQQRWRRSDVVIPSPPTNPPSHPNFLWRACPRFPPRTAT